MSEVSEDRSAGPPSRYARSAPANAALDRGPALRRLGDYAVAFATAALRSHAILAREQCLSSGYQPEIAQALLESSMANRSDRHLPNLSEVQGPNLRPWI
jgi:hypothetical protein